MTFKQLSCVTLSLSNTWFIYVLRICEPIIKTGIKEVQKSFGILEDFTLYSNFGEAMIFMPQFVITALICNTCVNL